MEKILVSLLIFLTLNTAFAQVDRDETKPSEEQQEEDTDEHSTIHEILLYIPNRVLDLFDIFRARVRVGPGVAVDARATSVAAAYAGTYASVYAGLPGPRLRRIPRSPIGLESHNGVTVSVADATADGGIGPNYSDTEIGVGLQAGIIGFDLGFDPVEIADFFTGFLTIDLRDDDI